MPERISTIPPAEWAPTPLERARRFLKLHGRKLWWVHSLYALALGASVVAFAQRGFDHARALAPTVGSAWLLAVVFFRVFGRGRATVDSARAPHPMPLYAMTYVLKNLYQGMLFFLLPFYFRATTFDSANGSFVALLALCAIVSTLDIVFDRVVFRFRWIASIFHALTLFACVNLIVPATFPNTRALVSLLAATALSVIAFLSLHATRRALVFGLVALPLALGVAYLARGAIPPVPMYVAHGAAGTILLPDGRLGMEVTRLDPSVIDKLQCVTDVAVPGGRGDALSHVWRKEGELVRRAPAYAEIPRPGVVRLRSGIARAGLPGDLRGRWTVDVETADDQLVGRVAFEVE